MNDGMGLGLDLGLGQEPMAPAVDVAQLTEAIRLILKDADLEQLSRRMIRKQLETQFGTDLSSYKDVINATILELIEQQQAEEEEQDEEEEHEPDPSDDDADDEQDEPPKRKKSTTPKKAAPKKRKRESGAKPAGGGFNMELSLSPELAAVVGAETMARPQIVKNLWAYIREHNLQDPNNKKVILFDDTLRSVFQRDSVTMFSMNKFVKRHVRKPADLPPGGWNEIHRDGVSSDEDTEAKKKKKPTKRAKKKEKGAVSEDGKKKNPFNTELSLSPELGSLLGSDRMARPQIVKALWAYIHEHELQDPADKRSILLDERMRQVFQRDQFTMFAMNKYIKRHARKFADLPPGGWADIPRDGVSSDEEEAKAKTKTKTEQ